jgi:hypothetical protein
MGISIRRRVVSLAAGLGLAASLSATDVFARDVKTITAVEVQEEEGLTRLILRGADNPIYTAFLRQDPPRLIIELPDVTFKGIETPLRVQNGVVNNVTLAAFGDPQISPSMARISIGLDRESEYELLPNGNELIVEVRPLPPQAAVPTVVAQVKAVPETPPASQETKEDAPTTKAATSEPGSSNRPRRRQAPPPQPTRGRLPRRP